MPVSFVISNLFLQLFFAKMVGGRLHVYRATSSFEPSLCIHSLGTSPNTFFELPKRDAQPLPQPLPLPPEVKGIKKIWRVCSSALITMLKLESTVDKQRKRRESMKAHKKACAEELAKQR